MPITDQVSGQMATYPKDSILEDWMQFARRNCENSDFQLLGTILPVCGAIMARTIHMDFFGTKYPNIYSMIVAAPGQRKSTLIKFARTLATRLIDKSCFIDSVTSEEALFDRFDPEKGGNPDQFLIEDEGNTLFTNWSETSYGKQVSKRFLSLYDCSSWNQSFKGNKLNDEGNSKRSIPQTSANLLVGATYNVCRMNKMEVKDGMWRRFLKYPAESLAREIFFSEKIDGAEWNDLAMKFESLRNDGKTSLEYKLSGEAKELYKTFKRSNTAKAKRIPNDLNPANDAKASVLSEEMSFLVKVAMIFERCRWAKHWKKADKGEIQADTLKLAYDHIQECNTASDSLENIAKRSEIRDTAETIHAQIIIEQCHKQINGFIPVSKTELTNRFCKNAGRRGAMNNFKLYSEIMPDLEKRGLVARHPVKGSKKVFYLFRSEE
ncbi:MAG: hypothetical protein ACPGJU_02815 [Coraliomargarita sp.]